MKKTLLTVLLSALAGALGSALVLQHGPGIHAGLAIAAAAGGRSGGVETCSSEAGDINADGEIDLSDAVGLLLHLFAGGAAPVVPCDPSELVARITDLEAQVDGLETELVAFQTTPKYTLPSTGQTSCYDESGWIVTDCASGACPGQDGAYASGCPSGEDRFADNGDGTVSDHCTGLMWQKETADISGDGDLTLGDYIDACQAMKFCEDLTLAGHNDWRLPNITELLSIVDYGRGQTSSETRIINPAFESVPPPLPTRYASSTSYRANPGYHWVVDFWRGDTSGNNEGYVRAVRGPSEP